MSDMENLAAGDGDVPRCLAGRLDASDNNHIRRSMQFKPGPTISLSSPRFLGRGYRFLPCYMFDGPASSLTFADGYGCPIAQKNADGEIKYLHPLCPLPNAPYYYLYLPWEKPQDDPITFELVMAATYNNGLAPECIRRYRLSDQGRLHPLDWGRKWTWP